MRYLQYNELNWGHRKKTDTLKFKEMFSFLIGLQTTKASLLCCKRNLWLADQGWVAPVEFLAL